MLFYKININYKSFEVIATFLSIFIGFCFTALSIVSTSKFSKKLFQLESINNNSKTLLHELIDEFKYAIIYSSICIIQIIIYFTLDETDKYILFENSHITIKFLLSYLIILFTIISFFYYFKLVKNFLQFILKEASTCEK